LALATNFWRDREVWCVFFGDDAETAVVRVAFYPLPGQWAPLSCDIALKREVTARNIAYAEPEGAGKPPGPDASGRDIETEVAIFNRTYPPGTFVFWTNALEGTRRHGVVSKSGAYVLDGRIPVARVHRGSAQSWTVALDLIRAEASA